MSFFEGENYNLWSLNMKMMFRLKDLWSLLEKGFSEKGDENRLKESLKKDAKALYLIQQALDERVLIRIFEAKSAKEVWETLRTKFQGNQNIITVKLHALHPELDTAKMKQGEKIQDFA